MKSKTHCNGRGLRALLCLATATALSACGDDGGMSPPDAAGSDAAAVDAAPVDAALQDLTITFAARIGDQDATCGGAYDGLGTSSSTVTINDLRFYVSNVRLLSGTEEVPVSLVQDEKWQYMDVALLDFEDGSGGCSTNGNEDRNDRVTGTVPAGTYDGIAFDLGVPYELNHEDLTAAPSPLNVAAMYWAWAVGHKFLRADFAVAGGGAWNVHLGSQMCDSPSPPTSPPSTGCSKPNRPRITLSDFDPASDVVVLDLAKLLEDSDLGANAGTAPGCQSFPDDTDDCTPLFPNLGLSFESGDCVNGCNDQEVFHVAKP